MSSSRQWSKKSLRYGFVLLRLLLPPALASSVSLLMLRLMSLLKKIRDRGVLHSAETLFNRIVPAALFRFSVGEVLELDVQLMCETLTAMDNRGFVMKCVEDADERDALRTTTWNSVPKETTHHDLGYAICGADDPQAVLGGVWGGVESFIEADLGFRIQLDPDQAWIYCAYVSKQARGKGVYKRILTFAADDLRNRGHTRLRVVVQPWNKASMYIHEKYSTRKVGRIIVVRFFFLASVFCTGQLSKNKTFTTKIAAAPVEFKVP